MSLPVVKTHQQGTVSGEMMEETQPKTSSADQKPNDHDHESTCENEQAPMVQFVQGTLYGLPKQWIVEQRPRTSLKYLGKIDHFFYEPYTGKRFRSLKSAQKHIIMEATRNEQTPDQASQLLLDDGHFKALRSSYFPSNSTIPKKNKKTPKFDFVKPPESVTWVLDDAEADKWSPCIGDTLVPEDVKIHWAQTFSSINSGNDIDISSSS
ncbi:methyl-CpG-binding domain-containing protein 6-like [Ziziphus jujuba]|uniref:Methyl-CpG-binding domain-containing protein 6-like n=1 Tax=Ziziphus jujuba TaxID=326968 RepID=A0ABM3I4Q9_ZIZJJ|nr:methyl-CpG-binding domain-containing protein 6-like [Ziziphus jujuba]